MTPTHKIIYINQRRTNIDEMRLPWTDVCTGHDEIYQAIECQERQQKALASIIPALGGKNGEALNEARIVKRTIIEEIVEGVGKDVEARKDA